MATTVRIRLVFTSSCRPEGQSRLPFPLNRQIIVCGSCGVLVFKRSWSVRWVSPRLLCMSNDPWLGFIALRGYMQWLWWIGAHGSWRSAGRGGWRCCWRRWWGTTRRRCVRLLIQRTADAVHHGPPGRPGGMAGCGRWRRGSGITGRAEAPDMVVRVQGGGGASHGGKWVDTGNSRASRAHRTAKRPHTKTAHENKTRARFRPGSIVNFIPSNLLIKVKLEKHRI